MNLGTCTIQAHNHCVSSHPSNQKHGTSKLREISSLPESRSRSLSKWRVKDGTTRFWSFMADSKQSSTGNTSNSGNRHDYNIVRRETEGGYSLGVHAACLGSWNNGGTNVSSSVPSLLLTWQATKRNDSILQHEAQHCDDKTLHIWTALHAYFPLSQILNHDSLRGWIVWWTLNPKPFRNATAWFHLQAIRRM